MFRLTTCFTAMLMLVGIANTTFGQDPGPDLEAVKEQADDAYRQRNFPQAIQLSNQVLAKQPQDHVALYLRGSAQVEMGILTGDADMLRRGIADARNAIRFEENGKPEYYLPYIYGMSHLADVEEKKAHAQTAKTVAESVLEREDLTAEQQANLLYQRAQANMRLQDNAAAERDLKQAIQVSPKHTAAHMALAEFAARTKSPAEAIAAFSSVVQSFPENPVAWNNRGMFLQSQGKTAEAIQDFTQAIKLNGRFIPAYINRGFAHLEAGDSAAAEAALSEVLTIDPSQVGALSLRATARLNQNKAAEALQDYQRVAEMAPENPMSHADLGFAQFFSGDFAGAFDSFNNALRIQPDMRFVLPWKLASAIRASKYQQQDYQAIISKPAESRDWIDTLVLFQLGQVDAQSLLKAAHPDDKDARAAQLCEAYYFIGMELLRRDRQKDAVAYWKQSIRSELPRLSAYRGAVFALKNSGASTQ
ncbi:lipoprotein NlpI [Thalassoglobus neptunius]|uniref:Lipoprotein NlpI n=1 Tax=Thalassoglobus neptunius TaxID=1938619 RepID=A0A5C5X828_9PLAN|nr:tetratricopeptide repeat protein [Thalassoglobus neptunius]TWT58443.1 lipoprotein NlpI [Thalassoglobus neptunius]